MSIDEAFIKNFLNVVKDIEKEIPKYKWSIPKNADKSKGDYGLLPEDKYIEVWAVPRSTAEFLRFLVVINKYKTILELGTSIGYSTLWLGLGAKETGGHVYTTEIFRPKAEIARKNFKCAKLDDIITLIEDDISSVLENWNYGKIDFVFMDADKQNYRKYFRLLLPLLSDNGLIVCDNAGNYSQYMQDFIDEVKNSKEVSAYFCNLDNGLLLISKSSNVNLMNYF